MKLLSAQACSLQVRLPSRNPEHRVQGLAACKEPRVAGPRYLEKEFRIEPFPQTAANGAQPCLKIGEPSIVS